MPCRASDYGEAKITAATELFQAVIHAMNSKHSRENIILKGLHKKNKAKEKERKELGEDPEPPQKTWLVQAKEEVCHSPGYYSQANSTHCRPVDLKMKNTVRSKKNLSKKLAPFARGCWT
jgi:hypothetical protein